MSVAPYVPKRKGPPLPWRDRASAHSDNIRTTSCLVSSLTDCNSNRRRTFIGNSRRSEPNELCISATIARAIPRALSSLGQKRSRPTLSLRYSMIARLSHTTVSPSHRIGTLPCEGIIPPSSLCFFCCHSSPNIGTMISSKWSPDCLAASQPRKDQLE